MTDFYADHDVALPLALLLREQGHGAVTTRDLGQEAAGDDEQLLTAAQHGWDLVTHNRKHFSLLHNAGRRWSRAWGIQPEHSGILVLAQFPTLQLAEALTEFLDLKLPLANHLYTWRPLRGWLRQE
ncbi:MAG TPA: DUF5615 family PIN-like protein [Chloroflexota bacterium]|nr:DUF5615 family PIN-like protein [Chloroflexota bacterium]